MKLNMRKVLLYLCLIIVIGCSMGIGYGLRKCDCNVEEEKTEEEIRSEKYFELSDKLIEYLDDIYNNDKWMNGGLEPAVYTITLGELESKGYDISMFVNPITMDKCSKEYTYGRFIILGTRDDGKTDYTYTTAVSCDTVKKDDEIKDE